jgi:hypothetical protein
VPLAEQLFRDAVNVLFQLRLSQAAPEHLGKRRLVLRDVRQPQLPRPHALQQHVVPQHDEEARRLDLQHMRQPQLFQPQELQLKDVQRHEAFKA